MLHCNMDDSTESLRLILDDIVGSLTYSRRSGDLGRLALVTYCDLRRWARTAHRQALADRTDALFLNAPFADQNGFLREVDALISEAQETLRVMTAEATK